MKTLKLLLLLNLIYFTHAQEQNEKFSLPDGFGLANQLKYSYDYKNERTIFENWFNLDYRHDYFSAGIRLDVFQPNDPNPAISRGKERYADISYKYIKAEFGNDDYAMNLTAGNFYSLFSLGMVLKSYEDRNIRVDNNLMGVKIDGYYKDFNFVFLSGSAENIKAERNDIIQAADIEYRGIDFLKAGFSFASNHPENNSIANTRLAAFRLKPTFENFDFYGEYGIKLNDDIKEKVFNGTESIVGKAFYFSGSTYINNLSFFGEYKHYDNFIFTSSDGTIIYNTPPSVRKDYTYSLLNRHPSALNQSNEKGFLVEVNYNPTDVSSFSITYSQTKTLPASSFYQRILRTNIEERTQLKEFYLSGQHKWNEKLSSILAFGYNEELDGNTKNFTPVVELRYTIDDLNSLKLIVEHQQTTARTTNEKYFTDLLMLEFQRSPDFSISLVGEMQTKEPAAGRKIRPTWKFIQAGYKISNHSEISLLIGSRQAGNICVGGVCRYEPEFNGVELKMFTRF